MNQLRVHMRLEQSQFEVGNMRWLDLKPPLCFRSALPHHTMPAHCLITPCRRRHRPDPSLMDDWEAKFGDYVIDETNKFADEDVLGGIEDFTVVLSPGSESVVA